MKVENGVLKLKVSKDKNSYKNGGIRTTSGFPCNTRLEVKAKLTKLNSLTLKNPDAEVSVKDYTIIKNTTRQKYA